MFDTLTNCKPFKKELFSELVDPVRITGLNVLFSIVSQLTDSSQQLKTLWQKRIEVNNNLKLGIFSYPFKRAESLICGVRVWSSRVCSTSERTLISPVIDFSYVLSQWRLLLLAVFLPVVFGFICRSNEDLEALGSLTEREREQKRRIEQVKMLMKMYKRD